MNTSTDSHAHLLEVLSSLNQIGADINRLGPEDQVSVETTLRLIVESACKVVPGSAAVIYSYEQASQTFDPASRASAGRPVPFSIKGPRSDGLGMWAIRLRRRVLSYEEDEEVRPPGSRDEPCVVACFPLSVAERAVGVLYVYLFEERRFTRLELLMLDNFVNQAAMAIYHAQRLSDVQRNLARKDDELVRLRRAGLLISSRLGLKETLEAILQMAMEVINAHYGILRLADRRGENLITQAVAGERLSRPLVEAIPINSTSIMSWVARHREPLCISDLREKPWVDIYYPLDQNLEMRSELAVPLINASGQLEGVLNLESPRVGAFDEQDSRLLQALASQAVIAIQEVRLLDALQDVAMRLLTHPCQQVLDRLVELACDLLNGAASVIWTLEGDELVARAASAAHPRGDRIPLRGSLAGQSVLYREAVTAEDVRTDPRFNRRELARAQRWARALVVPMAASRDSDPVGAFSVYSTEAGPGRFAESEWDKKVLTILAHYAALAVQDAARREALRVAQEQQAVAETFAAVGDVAANLLHHLNNKVGTIPARVQGIQDKCGAALSADPYLASNLAQIERSAFEAMEAVRDNLFHLRPIRLVPVNVASSVAAALNDVEIPPGVRVERIGVEDLPQVIAGERTLTLVFTNLLDNAVAAIAMVGEGTIRIQGTVRDGSVELAVSDTGPGIPPELHDRIFELNYTERGPSRKGRLGFGLWWVKTLMARLGGTIQVESDGRSGTTFKLRLPS